jgi:hypothetical protein
MYLRTFQAVFQQMVQAGDWTLNLPPVPLMEVGSAAGSF